MSRHDDFGELRQRYDIKETIGSGGFGKVKRAIHLPTGETVAIKIMDKNKLGDDLPRVQTEMKALKSLHHPSICRLYELLETQRKIFLVLEYCSGGELFDYIVDKDKLDEREARQFFREICGAVAYMHSKGFAHRDLKPENILIDEDHRIKLIDFGLCAQPDNGLNSALATCCGSPAYAAPELVSGRKYMGPEADVWSLGVLLYALLNGFLPFDDDNLTILYRKIKQGKYETPEWLSQDSVFLMAQLLQVDPKKRITMTRLLRHRWITRGGLAPVELASKYDQMKIDGDLVNELAIQIGMKCELVKSELVDMKYDALTATYLLLIMRKQQGRSGRLLNARPLKEFIRRRQRGSGSSSDDDDKENNLGQIPQTPEYRGRTRRPVSYQQPLTPSRGNKEANIARMQLLKDSDGVFSSSDSLDTDEVLGGVAHFNTPMQPSAQDNEEFAIKSRKPRGASTDSAPSTNSINRRAHVTRRNTPVVNRPSRSQTPPISKMEPVQYRAPVVTSKPVPIIAKNALPNPFSPERRTRSYDSNLDQLENVEPLTPTKKRNGIYGSFERGLDKVRLMLTPKKDREKSKEPRKVKAASNVSRVTRKDPKIVLETVHQVIQKMGIPNRVRGWIIRCQTRNNRGECQMDFEFEICRLGGRAAQAEACCTGVRRKRIKGDAMIYKKMAEDILSKVLV